MNGIESKSKPQRAQGGKGFLSHQISVQKSQQSIPLFPREERKEEEKGEHRREVGAWEGGGCCLCVQEKREEEREGEGVFNPNNSQPQKTKLPLDSIRH